MSYVRSLLPSLKERVTGLNNGIVPFKDSTEYNEMKNAVQIHSQINTPKEKIIQAAIKYDFDGRSIIFTLPRPMRHHHIFKEFNPLTVLKEKDFIETQGFISTNGFVNRKEGLKIAKESNQIIEKHPSYDELYSEDMW